MTGFRINHSTGTFRMPLLQASLEDVPGEPIFVRVPKGGGTVGLATLDMMTAIADNMRLGEIDEPEYQELYVFLPGYDGLIRCELGLAGSEKHPKMIVTADEVPQDSGFAPGILWTEDL